MSVRSPCHVTAVPCLALSPRELWVVEFRFTVAYVRLRSQASVESNRVPVARADGGAVLALGEVHTGLLRNHASVTQRITTEVLSLLLGERVRRSERPIVYAVSPDLLTGIDCRLATPSDARVRGIGTAVSRAAITGGHVLQGSTYARVMKSDADRRLPWSHYLSRPGIIETLGKTDRADLAEGFLAVKQASASLDLLNLGAISGRVMDLVQRSSGLDGTPPFRMARIRLRWVILVDAVQPTASQATLTINSPTVRTLRLTVVEDDLHAAVKLCEDLALHDWLLTALLELIERSRIGSSPRPQVVGRLSPAIDYLLHLWMPEARLSKSMLPLWRSLEQQPGFTKQWEASVNRIRDQVILSTIV
ncbi:MAG: SCO2521 family protein [Pseudonocardiales bacterium]